MDRSRTSLMIFNLDYSYLMPTLYITFDDMSSLVRFFSKSRFKLSFMSIHSLYVGRFNTGGHNVSQDSPPHLQRPS